MKFCLSEKFIRQSSQVRQDFNSSLVQYSTAFTGVYVNTECAAWRLLPSLLILFPLPTSSLPIPLSCSSILTPLSATFCSMQEKTVVKTSLAIRTALQTAINDRCSCGFQKESIFDGEFSCRTMKEHTVYRSTINGTSDKHTATELLVFIQDWIVNEGYIIVNQIRRWVSKTCSPLRIQHYTQSECSAETTHTGGSGGDVAGVSYLGGYFDRCLETVCKSLSPG